MHKFWEKYAPYWHICTTLIAAAIAIILWVGHVSAYDTRIISLEAQAADILPMQQQINDIAREVHDLWKARAR